ncbi:hypothetical protein LEP3755_40640 [Leptolyngbya sp. NIES-3755]|nr:hypothetical protein LEP3755_40640 [Leptolyngbya sp. NIES-3755]
MIKSFLLSSLSVLLIGVTACSQTSNAENPQVAASPTPTTQAPVAPATSPQAPVKPATSPPKPGRDLTTLFSRVWRVTKAPSTPAPGSIYVFLPNGTLLQTSCGEPYRISAWQINKQSPDILRVTEDGRQAYTMRITSLSDTTLQVQRSLDRSNENQALTLTAVQQEFVCPDIRR